MFIFIQLAIYISYLYLDITGQQPLVSSFIKFIAVFLCFLKIYYRNTSVKVIMALTVAADFFLVLTDKYTAGLLCFILVQTGYYIFITGNPKGLLYHFAVMISSGAIISALINIFIAPIDINVFLAAIYFSTLAGNIASSFRYASSSEEYRYLTIALILIMCCDIHVGVTNVFSSGIWYNFGLIAMWLFYLPSQVIIALLYSTSSQNRPYLTQTH